jgi:hypothetical protein
VIGPTIISSFRCSAFGNSVMAGGLDVAAAEHLVDVHLGHAAGRVAGVVVAGGVDDQAVQHALHLALDLVEQRLHVAGLHELGDVVVGVEALARGQQPLADLDRHGRALVGRVLGGRVGFHKHARYYQPALPASCPESDRVFGF